MDWGVKNILVRIDQSETGRAVMLAAAHGSFLGPVSSLEDPRRILEPRLPYTDSLMVKTCSCDGFDRAAVDCPAPVLFGGGPKRKTELDALRMMADGLAQEAVIHEGTQPEEALKRFQNLFKA